ncbi:DUF393 domain-containing protein [Teredinibacter sp. KSP-S5-2]|uniref:thiol-disulfide oxidoreductase DCC family protein n=1 Tax=Teredinibacter sp. KSP-S5-2 TaxID=3034506 RepID=UPI002934B15D|nr:DUF393 domain-containing protein [Teredinibacter sp. KSP-S5-2]WNO11388.1 DUF393 domain-containing protein [Teredinibacter sp. KSP-S5-2]
MSLINKFFSKSTLTQVQQLTVFYDARCPLCLAEMKRIKQQDNEGKIRLVDINEKGFNKNYPQIAPNFAQRILHAVDEDQRLYLGLDVTYLAWSLVGKSYWVWPLKWPLVRLFADPAYRLFARYRYPISYFLTRKKASSACNDYCK